MQTSIDGRTYGMEQFAMQYDEGMYEGMGIVIQRLRALVQGEKL